MKKKLMILLIVGVMGISYYCSDSYQEFQNEEIITPPSTEDEDDGDLPPKGNPGSVGNSGS